MEDFLSSDIQNFYAGRSVFLTGVSGFLGRAILEKLLRDCPRIGVINVLIRSKNGLDAESRLKRVLNSSIFRVLKSQRPTAFSQVRAVYGDLSLPGMALSTEDTKRLISTVSVIIHSAASVRFTDTIKQAINANVQGTRRVVELAKEIPFLKALVHVSTAYANCDRREVKEEIVVPAMVRNFKDIEDMSDEDAKKITPELIGTKPNTYTYTKSLAENLLLQEGSHLPIAIVRPSIIGACWKEPEIGYVDSLSGATGMIAAFSKGLLTCMITDEEKIADLIPLDITANAIIAIAFDTGTRRPLKIPIYNCCSGSLNPIRWGQVLHWVVASAREKVSKDGLHYPRVCFTKNVYVFLLLNFLVSYLLCLLMDGVAFLTKKKAKMTKCYKKVVNSLVTTSYFSCNDWNFETRNLPELQKRLSLQDREIFFTNISDINWPLYIKSYVFGVKKWILRESVDCG